MSFLHEEKRLPPDEILGREMPPCQGCGQPMWLMKVNAKVGAKGTTESEYEYECKQCGAKDVIREVKATVPGST